MALTFFKPNKANQGALFSMRFVAKLSKPNEDFKAGGFFLNMVKQVSWNEQKHTGVFSGGDSVSVKLDQFEAARILHVIERNYAMGNITSIDQDTLSKQHGFYNMHSGNNQSTHINFSPWQRKGANEQTGFALRITRVVDGEKTTFSIAFNFGDDILLREYIKLGLEHINMAGYQEDKRRFEENGNKNNGGGDSGSSGMKDRTPRKPAPAQRAPEPEPEEAGDSEDDSLF